MSFIPVGQVSDLESWPSSTGPIALLRWPPGTQYLEKCWDFLETNMHKPIQSDWFHGFLMISWDFFIFLRWLNDLLQKMAQPPGDHRHRALVFGPWHLRAFGSLGTEAARELCVLEPLEVSTLSQVEYSKCFLSLLQNGVTLKFKSSLWLGFMYTHFLALKNLGFL